MRVALVSRMRCAPVVSSSACAAVATSVASLACPPLLPPVARRVLPSPLAHPLALLLCMRVHHVHAHVARVRHS